MNDPDRYITVAIHTLDRAVELKQRLEQAGVEAMLHNVNLEDPVLASGVRVRIHERDLPLALRVIESPSSSAQQSHWVLVPIDFSDYSLSSCRIGIEYASYIHGQVLVMHTYLNERRSMLLPLPAGRDDSAATATDEQLRATAQMKMNDFLNDLRRMMTTGELPAVPIKSMITTGIPEEQILHTAQEHDVSLIVMGTNGTHHRRRQNVMGSVTAEVLDACQFPIFTIPIDISIRSLADIRQVVFFSNLIPQDILSFDSFARMFHQVHSPLQITIVPVVEKGDREVVDKSLQQLLTYCRQHYPMHEFKIKRIAARNFLDNFNDFVQSEGIDLIAVPDKKRNIFARLFNPSIAHRVLFQADTPMLVVPV